MNIPPDQNTRAEAMWRVISQRVDFRNKRVIDLGCGTGDFLWRAYVSGAKTTHGVDIDPAICKLESVWLQDEGCLVEVPNIKIDINSWVKQEDRKWSYDIAFCFSVLPYLDDIPATLQWMADTFPLCLIEAQYYPEPYHIKKINSDRGMVQLLVNNGFTNAEPIGKTYVEIRDLYRTIWMCSK